MDKKNKIKPFTMRLPYDLWHFMHIDAINNQSSVSSIIKDLIEQYKNKVERKSKKSVDII